MIRSILLILVSLTVTQFNATAQSELKKDSLLKQLSVAKEDTSKVLLLIDIGNEIEYNDPNQAGIYYLQAGNLSKRLNYKRGIIKFAANYTAILNSKGAYESALLLNKQAIELAKSLKDDLYKNPLLLP